MMWQDRRPVSQSPTSRNQSPLPRRQTGASPIPHRPGLLPRTSSLSPGTPSAISSISFSNASRNANGSALRHELRAQPSHEGKDPVQVLQLILSSHRDEKSHRRPSSLKHTELPLESLDSVEFADRTLEEVVQQFEHDDKLARESVHSIKVDDYDKEKLRFEDLHKSITACDQVLHSVETFLTGFQADLGAVSTEIESLQSRSAALNAKLENRKVVEKLLGPAVEELSLSPDLVRKISNGNIDEGWIKALTELDERSKAVLIKSQGQRKVKALDDLLPLLENLRNRAVERIRDYLVAQIKSLRSPNINAQFIQQQGLLKYKDLFTFLFKQQPTLGDEIRQAYVNTMKWYYSSQFARYESALRQIKLHPIDKNDLIGSADDSSMRRPRGTVVTHDVFSIGRRMDALKHLSGNALSSYVAEEDKSAHYLEVVFRSFNTAIVDNASFEYGFLSSFFAASQSFQAITRTFETVFMPTFKLGQDLTKSLADNYTDALGILLCVRLNQQFAFEFQKRKVPPGEGYTNGNNMLLWPRFQMVMDQHCESLRKLSLTVQSPAPHPITQKFATFLHGVLVLSSEAGDDEPVSRSLGRLRNDYEALLTKMSKSVGDARKRERFLANNYSFVGTLLEEARGRLADQNRKHFRELHTKYGGP